MPPGVSASLDLEIAETLRAVDQLEAALNRATSGFGEQLVREIRETSGVVVDLNADTAGLAGDITAAVDAADTTVTVAADVDPDLDRAATEIEEIGDAAENAEQKVDRLGGSFRDAAAATAGLIAGRELLGFFGSTVDAASDLAEATSKVGVVFGDAQQEILDFGAASATAVGLAERDALGFLGTFGNLFTAMGLARDAAADMSIEVVTLGADLASFNNLEVDDTLEKLRSGLVGEIEPLRSLGVSFGAAEVEARAMQLGLQDANGELSEGAKIQARMSLILEQTAAAQGDFARTSDGLANSQRIANAEMENARAELGESLLPLMTEATQAITFLTRAFGALPGPVQTAVVALGGLAAVAGLSVVISGRIIEGWRTVSTTLRGTSGATTGVVRGLGLIGGAAAGIALTGMALDALGVSAQGLEVDIEAAGRATTRELVDGFLKLRDALPGEELDLFREIAEGNIGTAQRLRDQLAAQGEETAELDRILQDVIASEKQLATDADAAAAAVGRGADATDRAAESASGMLAQMGRWADELQKQGPAVEQWALDIDAALDDAGQAFSDFTDWGAQSLHRFVDEQRWHLAEQRNWRDNLVTIAEETSVEFAAYLAQLGPGFAGTVADMTRDGDKLSESFWLWAETAGLATDDMGDEFQKARIRMGREMSDGQAEVLWILSEMRNDVSDGAHEVGKAIADSIAKGIEDSKAVISWTVTALAHEAWAEIMGIFDAPPAPLPLVPAAPAGRVQPSTPPRAAPASNVDRFGAAGTLVDLKVGPFVNTEVNTRHLTSKIAFEFMEGVIAAS